MPVADYVCRDCGEEGTFESHVSGLPEVLRHPLGECDGNCRFEKNSETEKEGIKIPE